ncbi:protein phosphatase 1 regulatory subunit 37 isoform X2 [Latimeria chalumnae]|uniref:protein phosphatase 1 regulatory subunit 37 isoform X2 n=1 Tax=Latimeria chalumnae TaxID=7897 RepID=UPI00313D974B
MDGQTAGGAGREEEGGQETAGGSLFHWESRSKQEGEPSAAGGALEKGEPSPPLPEGNGKHKHGAKRVTFPSDEDIVSGAVEPKNPWRHAQNVTVEEILAAYRQTCQKLNCKPMTKLLKQIQEFKDLTQRIDCLDLKGEKLDYKACEALEEVFKRVQFKVVDLEQTNLDEDGASALFDMIEYYESATQLNISFNKHIGTRGWQAAAHMMRKTNCLQYLEARNTPLLDHSAPFVARALRISSSLTVLHLESASLSGRPLMLLATALKMNMNLRELYLAENKLNGLQDSAQLGNLLKFNCYIQILDLRNNNILDSGLAYICEGLKEQRKGLVTLVLWNNQLTHVGMAYLGVTLPHTQSLETLNLGHNPISNEGVRHLKNGLIANRSVLRLGLASTKLTCEGAVAVAEFIAESPRLLRLDLRENEIKTGGLMALSLALKVNHSLLRLDLDREPKKETVKSFIETQKALLAEIQNGCKRNFILAKENEEKEQQMQQSASMPEIAVTTVEEGAVPKSVQPEDNTKTPGKASEELKEPVAEVNKDTEVMVQEENHIQDSDLDTQEEVKGQNESPDLQETQEEGEAQRVNGVQQELPEPEKSQENPGLESGDARSQLGADLEQQPTLEAETSESTPVVCQEGTLPRKNERRISVSSPGRGHKIFVVTRVESPPEQESVKNPPARQDETLPQGSLEERVMAPAPQANEVETQRISNSDPETEGSVGAAVLNSEDCDHLARAGSLPNGLKAEFVLALPEAAAGCDGKFGSCEAEHEYFSSVGF